MSNRYQTKTFSSGSVPGGQTVQVNVSGLPSLFNIVNILVTTDSAQAYNVRIYKSNSFASNKRLSRFEAVVGTLNYPVDRTNNTNAAALEGCPIPYDDDDNAGSIHWEFVNSDGTAHTFSVTFEYDEVPKFDGPGNATFRAGGTFFGQVNITSPLGVEGLRINGAANQFTARHVGSPTTGQSYGLHIQAGTNSTDSGLQVNDATDSLPYFTVRGDGRVGIGVETANIGIDVHVLGQAAAGIHGFRAQTLGSLYSDRPTYSLFAGGTIGTPTYSGFISLDPSTGNLNVGTAGNNVITATVAGNLLVNQSVVVDGSNPFQFEATSSGSNEVARFTSTYSGGGGLSPADVWTYGPGARNYLVRTNAMANTGIQFRDGATNKWAIDFVDTVRDSNEGLAFIPGNVGAGISAAVMYLTRTGGANNSGSVAIGPADSTIRSTYGLSVTYATASTTINNPDAFAIVNTDPTNGNWNGMVFRSYDTGGSSLGVAGLGTFTTSHSPGAMSADLAFGTRNAGTYTEKMRLTSAGQLLLGATAVPAGYSSANKFVVQDGLLMLNSTGSTTGSAIVMSRATDSNQTGTIEWTDSTRAVLGIIEIATGTQRYTWANGSFPNDNDLVIFPTGSARLILGAANNPVATLLAQGALSIGNMNALTGSNANIKLWTQINVAGDSPVAAFVNTSTGTRGLFIRANADSSIVTLDATGSSGSNLAFATQGTEWARFTTTGHLLIGTTTNSAMLTVAGSAALLSDSATLTFGASSDAALARIGANKLAIQNGNNAQTFQVWGAKAPITGNATLLQFDVNVTAGNQATIQATRSAAGAYVPLVLYANQAALAGKLSIDIDGTITFGSTLVEVARAVASTGHFLIGKTTDSTNPVLQVALGSNSEGIAAYGVGTLASAKTAFKVGDAGDTVGYGFWVGYTDGPGGSAFGCGTASQELLLQFNGGPTFIGGGRAGTSGPNPAGRTFIGVPATAPTDGDLFNGSITGYLDQVGNSLKFRVKYSDGTLKTGSMSLL